MTRQFWTFLGIGLAVVLVAVAVTWVGSKGSHLDLDGEVLKVRTFQMNPNATLVMLDFRVTNPSDVQFVVGSVQIQIVPATGEAATGTFISKPDIENVFKYEKLLGPKYNDVLGIRDRIQPHQKMDRMVGARFELPEAAIDNRKSITLRLTDVDGAIAELTEKKK